MPSTVFDVNKGSRQAFVKGLQPSPHTDRLLQILLVHMELLSSISKTGGPMAECCSGVAMACHSIEHHCCIARLIWCAIRPPETSDTRPLMTNFQGALTICCAGYEGIDGLASTAAQRALELREQTTKRARPLKKKALTDFLKALLALGVSRNRSAVPAERRGAASWFAQVCHVLRGKVWYNHAIGESCDKDGMSNASFLLACARFVGVASQV